MPKLTHRNVSPHFRILRPIRIRGNMCWGAKISLQAWNVVMKVSGEVCMPDLHWPFFCKNPNICIAFGIGCIFLFLIFTFCYCFGIVNPQNYKYWAVLSWYLVLYCYCMFASFCQKRFKWINYLLNHVKHLEKSCIFCMNVAYFREMLNI